MLGFPGPCWSLWPPRVEICRSVLEPPPSVFGLAGPCCGSHRSVLGFDAPCWSPWSRVLKFSGPCWTLPGPCQSRSVRSVLVPCVLAVRAVLGCTPLVVIFFTKGAQKNVPDVACNQVLVPHTSYLASRTRYQVLCSLDQVPCMLYIVSYGILKHDWS